MKNVRNSICFSLLLGVTVSAGTNSYAQAPAPAQAASKANVEIFVIHAKEGPPFVDPLIGNMPQLAQPPFKSYTNLPMASKFTLASPRMCTAGMTALGFLTLASRF